MCVTPNVQSSKCKCTSLGGTFSEKDTYRHNITPKICKPECANLAMRLLGGGLFCFRWHAWSVSSRSRCRMTRYIERPRR